MKIAFIRYMYFDSLSMDTIVALPPLFLLLKLLITTWEVQISSTVKRKEYVISKG